MVGLSAGPALRRIAPALHTAGLIGVSACRRRSGRTADTYHLLTLFGEVFEKVRADYVAPVKDRELIDNALNGMVSSLDPHRSHIWTPSSIATCKSPPARHLRARPGSHLG